MSDTPRDDAARLDQLCDLESLSRSLQSFIDTHDRPTLVIVRSHIGWGAPHKHDTRQAHGEPLGAEEARLAKQSYGFDPDAQFAVPEGVQAHFGAPFGRRGARAHEAWNARLEAIVRSIRTSPNRSTTCSTASCPTAGTARYRASPPTRRAWRRAILRARC